MSRDFDGTGLVNFGDLAALDGLVKLTVAWRFAYDALVDFQTHHCKLSADTNNGWGVVSGAAPASFGGQDDLLFTVRNGAVKGGHTTGLGLAADGVFHHAVMAYDGVGATDADKLKAWVDGIQRTLTFALPTLPASIGVNAGGFCIGGADLAPEIAFNGKLQGVALWTGVVLTTSEIAQLALGVPPCAIRPEALALYTPMDQGESPEPNYQGSVGGAGIVTGGAPFSDNPSTLNGYAIRCLVQPLGQAVL